MDTKRLNYTKFGFLLVIFVTVILVIFKTSARHSLAPFAPTAYNEDNEDTEQMASISDVYQQRIKQVHQVCLEMNKTINFKSKTLFRYSKAYQLGYHLIPKIGSTTFQTVFSILNDKSSDRLLTQARDKFRKLSLKSVVKDNFEIKQLEKYTVLFPSRDPYTRLFSAYIDKVYIFNNMELVQNVMKHSLGNRDLAGLQKYNVTFQMFLDYALDKPNSRKTIGGHYQAIFVRNTWLCLLQQFIVIKQETFAADVEYALKAVKVDDYKMNFIRDALHSRRAEITVSSILKDVINKLQSILNKMGQSNDRNKKFKATLFVLDRVWDSFQIQGYINDNSKFPMGQLLSGHSDLDVDFILRIFLDEVEQNPLTHSESSKQRHQALKAAYNNIKDDTMKKIQEVYELDFKAFGYNSNRPK